MQTTLDDAYANAPHIPEGATYPARWATAAATFRASVGPRGQIGLRYGPSPRQTYDLFSPETPAKGTMIFVHSGYWRMTDPSLWSHLAQGALARGWQVALPGYELCPDVTIAQITTSIAQAVMRISRHNDGPISLSGHSAGGHLVARLCAAGMLPDAVRARIRQVVPISPLSDLRPLLQTSMNADFGLNEATARAESPVFDPAPDLPVHIWVGGAERPAFLDQAAWLAKAWACSHQVEAGKHHYDVIDALCDARSDMVRLLTP